MRTVIAGGNSYIGRQVSHLLLDAGHQVTWLSHRPGRVEPPETITEIPFIPTDLSGEWRSAIADADAVVNLSGYPIASRWNDRVKRLLIESRIDTTRALVDAVAEARTHAANGGVGPRVFVGACGIGIYGDRGDTELAEDASVGGDWLADLAVAWERETLRATEFGCRAVSVRNGLVLGNEGLVPKMLLPMTLYAGGPIGTGRQWVPWIHHADIAGIYRFAIERDTLVGPLNACAPTAVRMRDFSAALGRVVHRPSWLPVPGFALKLVLGEVAPYMLYSQRARSDMVVSAGYSFRFDNAEDALRDVVANR